MTVSKCDFSTPSAAPLSSNRAGDVLAGEGVESPPLCGCGCGESVTRNKETHRWNRYRAGHGYRAALTEEGRANHRKAMHALSGANAPSWKGGCIVNDQGYRLVYLPGHHRADNKGYVREHILVMESVLQRPLERHEQVHHKDENRLNNHPDNLEVLSHAEHKERHRNPDNYGDCEVCGNPFRKARYHGRVQGTCSRKCAWVLRKQRKVL